MSNDELIAKARQHASIWESKEVFTRGIKVALHNLTKIHVREAVVVTFEDSERDEHIRITVDKTTGDCIESQYHPPPKEKS